MDVWEKHWSVALHMCPNQGLACNPGIELVTFALLDDAQAPRPHQSGLTYELLKDACRCIIFCIATEEYLEYRIVIITCGVNTFKIKWKRTRLTTCRALILSCEPKIEVVRNLSPVVRHTWVHTLSVSLAVAVSLPVKWWWCGGCEN